MRDFHLFENKTVSEPGPGCRVCNSNRLYTRHFILERYMERYFSNYYTIHFALRNISFPSKHETLTQCLSYVVPPSSTLAQHKATIGSTSRVCKFYIVANFVIVANVLTTQSS